MSVARFFQWKSDDQLNFVIDFKLKGQLSNSRPDSQGEKRKSARACARVDARPAANGCGTSAVVVKWSPYMYIEAADFRDIAFPSFLVLLRLWSYNLISFVTNAKLVCLSLHSLALSCCMKRQKKSRTRNSSAEQSTS